MLQSSRAEMKKKKILLVNLLMSLTVLFAMLFQTLHSYEHIYWKIHDKHCEHKYTPGQKEITHSHSEDTNCAICHFAFSTFISNSSQNFSIHNVNVTVLKVILHHKFSSAFFKGSLFALRAPPTLL